MRLFLLSSLFIAAFVVVLLRTNTTLSSLPSISPTTPTPSPTPVPPQNSVGVQSYRVSWIDWDPSSISLIPNFTQQRTARSFVDASECTNLVSAGFYTKDHQPTGLFIADGKTLMENIPNTFLNWYFVIDRNNIASIRQSPPEEAVRVAVQTGPILIRDKEPLDLSIRNDEFARRMSVGVTSRGYAVFLALYDQENTGSGPKLADTPAILSRVANRLDLTHVINLDGGSASAFIRGDLVLQELSPVGSFFCLM